MKAEPVHAFDAMAEGYDRGFSESRIGRLMRAAVWARMDGLFQPGQQILELGCGTGEDAAHLARRGVRVLATDVSAGMLAVTRAKVDRLGLGAMVTVRQLNATKLAERDLSAFSLQPSAFDGALSNFGALNCVEDLAGVAAGLARLLRPGAPALLCVMGPLVPWEWGWYLGRGEPRKAFRRLAPGGVAWRGLRIGYPSIGALRRAFGPWFTSRGAVAVGALVPPSYAEPWATDHPTTLWALHRLEGRFGAAPPLPWLADHYLVELARR